MEEIRIIEEKIKKNERMTAKEINKLWNYKNNIYNISFVVLGWNNGFKYMNKVFNSEVLK